MIKELFEMYGEHVFDHDLNSMEIKAYCGDMYKIFQGFYVTCFGQTLFY